jgi:hypothetical protein
VVPLQGVPTRELRMLIAERRTASIRHAHSVEVEALEPVVKGWALEGQAAVSGAAGEDAGSRPWSVRVEVGMRLEKSHPTDASVMLARILVSVLIGTRMRPRLCRIRAQRQYAEC